jgi:hypothetical protein
MKPDLDVEDAERAGAMVMTRMRGWARLALVGLSSSPACVGLPPEPPEREWTTVASNVTGEGTTTANTTGEGMTITASATTSEAMTLEASVTLSSEGVGTGPSSECGNGRAEEAEECDGADLEGMTCESLGYMPGLLACSVSCTFDISMCGLTLCDPILQDCAADEGCYPIRKAWGCASDASGAVGAYGDACEFVNACDPGLTCLNVDAVPGCGGAVGCCSEFCELSDPRGDAQCSGVAGGQVCLAWYEAGAAPPGYEDVGVCAVRF